MHLERFKKIFEAGDGVDVQVAIGNHDVRFGLVFIFISIT